MNQLTINLCVKVIDSRQQAKRKVCHVVQINVCRLPFAVNVILRLNSSNTEKITSLPQKAPLFH